MATFDALFDRIMQSDRNELDMVGICALCQYVCDRLDPGTVKAKEYLDGSVEAFIDHPISEALPTAAGTVMAAALLEREGRGAAPRTAEACVFLNF